MARIASVDLPRDKRVEIALTYIYGIGLTLSQEILKTTGISPDTRVRDLTEEEVAKLRETIDKGYKVEGDLRREDNSIFKRLIEIVVLPRSSHRRDCRFADSEPKPMQERVKAPAGRSAQNAAVKAKREGLKIGYQESCQTQETRT